MLPFVPSQKYHYITTAGNVIQFLMDLMNQLVTSPLFIKPGNSLNLKFLGSSKIFDHKNDSLNLDDSLKLNLLNPADSVVSS